MTRFFTDAFNSQGGHTRKITIGRVVKPIPPFSVAVGVPARVIRKRGADGEVGARAPELTKGEP